MVFHSTIPLLFLSHTFRIQVFKYNVGAHIGNITMIWKLPSGELEQTQKHVTLMTAKKQVPVYEKRATGREIKDRYAGITDLNPVLRRNLVEFVTGKIPS